MAHKRIYLSPPHMGKEELSLVKDVFESNWIAPLGPMVDAFEREFAEFVNVQNAAATSSGTAALHLALVLAGVERDDEVLCSSLTFAASANAIVYQGAIPVFVDSDRQSWNMDPGLLRDALEKKAKDGKIPKAVILVHIYGQSADLDPIKQVCDEYGVMLIEDAAEALGTTYKGKHVGGVGEISVFSFNGNKIITTSGGGMLVSNKKEHVDQARFLSTQARNPNTPEYEHSFIGYNYRMSNVLAAIGLGQLHVLDSRIQARLNNHATYQKLLGDLPGIEFMPECSYGKHAHWLTVITINPEEFGVDREQIRLALEKENIESRPVWRPLHTQPVFKDCEMFGGAVSEQIFEQGLCLPSGSALTASDLKRIAFVVESVAKR